MSLLDRLRTRPPYFLPSLTGARDLAIKAFFDAHPESEDVYLSYDGRVEDGNHLRKRMTSRTAQLVSIATEGFPINIGREAFFRWARVWA